MGLSNREIIMKAQTANGAWTRKQLAAWGVPWPPPKGWKTKLEAGPQLPPEPVEEQQKLL